MDANKAMVVEDIAMDVFMSGPFLQWVSVCDFFDKRLKISNLFMTSKHELSNSWIKNASKKPKSILKPLFNCVLVLIYYFKKYFKPCFLFL